MFSCGPTFSRDSRREAITDYNRALVLALEMHAWLMLSLCWEPCKRPKMFLSQAPEPQAVVL